MVATGSTSRKYGLRSGVGKFKSVVVNDSLDVNGNITFGDASTDNLLVSGTSTFASTVDINSIVDIDTSTTATNAILDIAQTGTGQVIRIDQNATTGAGIAFEIDDESTGTKNVVKVAAKSTGVIVQVNQESTTSTAAVVAINADSTDAAAYAIDIDSETTGVVINIAAAATTVPVLGFDASSFQAIDCTSSCTERLVIKCGTNTRYLRVYSS